MSKCARTSCPATRNVVSRSWRKWRGLARGRSRTMGYHTRYGLTMNPFRPDILMELARDPEGKFPFNENGEAEDSTTWYDHETDMAAVSQRYPDVVFDLHGAGEEQGDEWHKYFKNGKVQTCRAKVEFDPFDEAKLEDVK